MTTRLCNGIGHKSNRMISEAIEKSGASLKAAGNDLSESLGMIVAGNAALQNPNTVGQMLKTFSMRLRGATKAELDELGLDTEGMASARKSVVKQFKSMAGIDIMEGRGYKSTFQILDELLDKWESLSDAEHAALSEAIGGKRGGSVMASLMQNWEEARQVVEKAEASTGTAMNRHALMMESAAKKLEVVKANAQETAYNIIDSDVLKAGIDLLGKLLSGLNDVFN